MIYETSTFISLSLNEVSYGEWLFFEVKWHKNQGDGEADYAVYDSGLSEIVSTTGRERGDGTANQTANKVIYNNQGTAAKDVYYDENSYEPGAINQKTLTEALVLSEPTALKTVTNVRSEALSLSETLTKTTNKLCTESGNYIDGFENGNYTANPVWTAGAGTWTVQSTVSHSGSYALRNDADGAIYVAPNGYPSEYSAWIYVSAITGKQAYMDLATTGTVGYIGFRDSEIKYRDNVAWNSFAPVITPSINTWYQVKMVYVNGAATYNCYVYNAAGTLLGSATGVTVGTAGTVTYIRLEAYGSVNYAYFDDVSYGSGAGWFLRDRMFSTASKQTSLTDSLILSDTISKLHIWGKVLSETLVLSEAISKTTSKPRLDALILTDTLTKFDSRTISEALTLSEARKNITSKLKSDALVLTEATALKTPIKAITDALILSETLSKSESRTISDALIEAETLAKTTSKPRSETLVLADTILKTGSKSLSEALLLVEALNRYESKTLSEAFVLTANKIRKPTIQSPKDDAITSSTPVLLFISPELAT